MSEVVQSKREKNSRRSTEGAEKHGDSRRERPPRSSSSLAFSEEEPYITLRVRPGKQPGQSSDLMMHSMYSPPTVEEASEVGLQGSLGRCGRAGHGSPAQKAKPLVFVVTVRGRRIARTSVP